MSIENQIYDVIVVGAGHAGCEAAFAASGMGAKTLFLTMNINSIAQMSCNPAIGGLAKGHLVREIDALGGKMGVVTDEEGIQFRMLNRSKGPAVWSPRAQVDRQIYSINMRFKIESQANLILKQANVVDMIFEGNCVKGVVTQNGIRFLGSCVILTNGTFLNGLIHVGLNNYSGGRSGEFASLGLTDSLVKKGLESARLKTGTPPRIDGKTVNFSQMEAQPGDCVPVPFSYQTEKILQKQIPCYLTYTSKETHDIIHQGLDRSPLYTGIIVGVGPRYCPSIETKIIRFADKEKHQIFLEPEGRFTTEYYVNGFATSLSWDTQLKAIRTISGLENVEISRLGYAIEYDYFPPTQLKHSLECKKIRNLYLAGQINGTSGYEEAAAQGIMAGINTVLKLKGQSPFILKRSEALIGVLIDDLVTKGTKEPYRMFTSLAEHRLILRQDNADLRLMDYGYKFGLLANAIYERKEKKVKLIERMIQELKEAKVSPAEINSLLSQQGTSTINEKDTLFNLLKRPQLRLRDIRTFKNFSIYQADDQALVEQAENQVEINIKYEGFINKELERIERMAKNENKKIPENFEYSAIKALSVEAKEKLSAIRPVTIGQASRIAGISPADISVILIYLKRFYENDMKK